MLLNVIATDGHWDLYAREYEANFSLELPSSESESDKVANDLDDQSREFIGAVEVEKILDFGPGGQIETVKINNREYHFAGVNTNYNKAVFKNNTGAELYLGFIK